MKRKVNDKDSESDSPEKKKATACAESKTLTLANFKQGLKNVETDIALLKSFNQLAHAFNEGDATEDFLKSYLLSSPECSEILKCLAPRRSIDDLTTIYESVLYILIKTAKNASLRRIGHAVCSFLINHKFTQIEFCINSNDHSAISIALKLLSAMVLHGKNFAKQIALRVDANKEGIARVSKLKYKESVPETNDVRVNFVNFILSFLMLEDHKMLQHILETTTIVSLIFSTISSDSADVVKLILKNFTDKVVKNQLVSKTAKVKLFGQKGTLLNVSALFTWRGESKEMNDDQSTRIELEDIRNHAYQFLEEICCSFKFGINFYDKSFGTSTKIANKVILAFLSGLRSPQNDNLKTKLVAKILQSCPDLLNLYFKKSDVSFDPGTSEHWVLYCVIFREIYEHQPEIPQCVVKHINDKNVAYSIDVITKMTEISLLPCTFPQTTFKTCLKSHHKLVKIGGLCIMNMILEKLCSITKFVNDPSNLKQSKFSKSEIDQFIGCLKDKVLNNIVELSLLTNLCSNSESNSENKHISIFYNVVKCLNLYSDSFPENFSRSTFDFSGLLSGLIDMTEIHAEDNKEEVEKAYIATFELLLKNPQAYMWFKTSNKQKSPFYYLLKILAKPLTDSVANKAIELMRQILVINLIYEEQMVEEFDFWINGLSYLDQDSVNTCLPHLSSIVGLIARKPYKFLDMNNDSITKEYSSETLCKEKWWIDLPEVKSDQFKTTTKDCESPSSNASHAKSASTVLIAFFENVKSLSDLETTKNIDLYLSMVFRDLFHQANTVEHANSYLTVIDHYSVDISKDFKHIRNIFEYSKRILNPSLKTKSFEMLNESTNVLMQWFVNTMCSTNHIEVSAPRFDVNNLATENSPHTHINSVLRCVNQILLYIDIVRKISVFDNKFKKVCYYHLVNLLFTAAKDTPYNQTILNHQVTKENILESENGENMLSEFLTPKILELLSMLPDGKGFELLIQKYTNIFIIELPKYMEDEGCTCATVNVFPIVCQCLSFQQLQQVKNCILKCYKDIPNQTNDSIINLFYCCMKSMFKIAKTLNVNFPEAQTVPAFCDILTIINMNDDMLKLFQSIIHLNPGKTIKHFPKRFIAWCLQHSSDNKIVLDILTYCACESIQLKKLSKILSKHLSEFDCTSKNKIVSFVIAVLNNCVLSGTDKFKKIVSTIFNNYSYLLGRNITEIKTCEIDLYERIVKLLLLTNVKNETISQICFDGLKLSSECTGEEASFVMSRIKLIVKIKPQSLFEKSGCDKFFKKAVNICFQAITFATADVGCNTITVLKYYDIFSDLLSCAIQSEYKNLNKVAGTFWKKFFTTSLRRFIDRSTVINIITKLVPILYENQTELLPIALIRKMIIGHSKFLEIICTEDETEIKKSLLQLLEVVCGFCDPSCFEENDYIFLFGSYQATLGKEDRIILNLLQKYEKHNIYSENFRPYLWGALAVTEYSARKNLASVWKKPGPEHFIACINADIMKTTILEFPIRKRIGEAFDIDGKKVYDPEFLLPLCYEVLDLGNFIDCRLFISSRVVSFLLMSLSSHCNVVRSLAISCLDLFYKHIESSLFAEKNMLLYIFQLLRNEMKVTEDSVVQKLSTVVAKFLIKSVELLLTPGDHMYSMICKFLLIKPHLDMSNVPEFYVLFFSSQMENKIERRWILNLLSESILDTNDYHVLEKRKTCKILLSFYNTSMLDSQSNRLILKILANVCKINSAVSDMVVSNGLLAWVKSICYVKKVLSIQEKFEIVNILYNISYHYKQSKEKERSFDILKEIKSICFVIMGNTISNLSVDDNMENIKIDTITLLISTIEDCIFAMNSKKEISPHVLQASELLSLHNAGTTVGLKGFKDEFFKLMLNWKSLKIHPKHKNAVHTIICYSLETFSFEAMNSDQISKFCDWLHFWVNELDDMEKLKSKLQNLKFNFVLNIKCSENLQESYELVAKF